MSGLRGATWEVGEESGCLDPGASSTALTSTLQRCTLHSIVKLDSDPSRPLSLSSSPPDLRHTIEMALLRRRLSAVEVSEASSDVSGEPLSSRTTPPDLVDSSIAEATLDAPFGKISYVCGDRTWGEWTWTRHALRSIRCASFARSTSVGGAAKRRKQTDAKRSYHETLVQTLGLLQIEYKVKKRLRAASDVTREDQGYAPVDKCGGSFKLPSHAQAKSYQRPPQRRPLWDKSLL